ncbi:MAG TPA: hypothetical protein VFP44_16270 [Usitatibacter sp.]|nr:hypothetical protein [Usitatibacter sp.]
MALAVALLGIKLWLVAGFANSPASDGWWLAQATSIYDGLAGGTLNVFGMIASPQGGARTLALAVFAMNGQWNPLLDLTIQAALQASAIAVTIMLVARASAMAALPAILFALAAFGIPYDWPAVVEGFQAGPALMVLFGIPAMWLTATARPPNLHWCTGLLCAALSSLSLTSGALVLPTIAAVAIVRHARERPPGRRGATGPAILVALALVVIALALWARRDVQLASPGAFLENLREELAWPAAPGLFWDFARNAPAIAYVAWAFRKPATSSSEYFLAATAVWTLLLAVSAASGLESHTASMQAREMTLFIDFSCLAVLARELMLRHPWLAHGIQAAWITAVVALLLLGVPGVRADLAHQRVAVNRLPEASGASPSVSASIAAAALLAPLPAGAPMRDGANGPAVAVDRALANWGAFVLFGLLAAAMCTLPQAFEALAAADDTGTRLPARRSAWERYAAIALIMGVLLALIATRRTIALVATALWHATMIALPMASVMFALIRRGVRDLTLLALSALAGGGLAAYAVFWAWWLSPTAGAFTSMSLTAASVAASAWIAGRIDRGQLRAAAPIATAAVVWVSYAIFILGFGLAPSGFEKPLAAVTIRYTDWLPMDNALPFVLASQITQGHVQVPMAGDWLSSDRPPLQAAYFLASGASLYPAPDVHYQVQATLLQALWVPGMWLLLHAFRVGRLAIFLTMAVAMFSGFAFTQDLYTWPKLFPVGYIAATAAILFHPRRRLLADWRVGLPMGAASALALLCHPGSVFVFVGLGLGILVLRRIPSLRFVAAAAAAAAAVMMPWSLYQTFVDPPGNRLLKYHLAGVMEVDPRPVVETVRGAYAAMTVDQYIGIRKAQLGVLLGPVPRVAELIGRAVTGRLTDTEGAELRHWQFHHVGSALGVLSLAPLALLVPIAWRSRASGAALSLFAIALATILFWMAVMYMPVGTSIPTSSLATVCFLFAACMLAFFALSRWLAIAAAAFHSLMVLPVYARVVKPIWGTSLADCSSFVVVAFLALALSMAALWKLAGVTETIPP